jgi:hypothetical protein
MLIPLQRGFLYLTLTRSDIRKSSSATKVRLCDSADLYRPCVVFVLILDVLGDGLSEDTRNGILMRHLALNHKYTLWSISILMPADLRR